MFIYDLVRSPEVNLENKLKFSNIINSCPS